MSRSMTGGESSAVLPPQTARTETIGGHTELDSPAAHDCAGSHFEKLGTVARDAAPPGPAALTVSIRRVRPSEVRPVMFPASAAFSHHVIRLGNAPQARAYTTVQLSQLAGLFQSAQLVGADASPSTRSTST